MRMQGIVTIQGGMAWFDGENGNSGHVHRPLNSLLCYLAGAHQLEGAKFPVTIDVGQAECRDATDMSPDSETLRKLKEPMNLL